MFGLFEGTQNVTFEKGTNFKWIKGDNFGTVVTLQEQKGKYLVFTNGSRCDSALVGDMLIEDGADTPQLNDIDEIKNYVASNKNVNHSIDLSVPISKSIPTPNFINQNVQNDNPIHLILNKQKIKSSKISLTVDVKIPKEDLIKLLSDSFDGVETTLISWISSQITSEKIEESIKAYLKNPKKNEQKGLTT